MWIFRVYNEESFGASAPRVSIVCAIFATAAQSDRKQRDKIVLPYGCLSAAVKFLRERETPRKIEIVRTHPFSIVSAEQESS